MPDKRLVLGLIAASLALQACSPRDPSQEGQAPAAAVAPANGAPSPAAGEQAVYLENAGIRVLAPRPAAAGEMALFHTSGSDAVVMVTPVASAPAAVVLVGKGMHDVGMAQDGCSHAVRVIVSDVGGAGSVAEMALSGGAGPMTPLRGDDAVERRLEIRMADGASDNYSCNVIIRRK